MKIKHVEKNEDGEMEASVMLSNQEIKFLKEAVNMHVRERNLVCPSCGTNIKDTLGDIDDAAIIKIKKELRKELHEAWKQLNPS